MFVNLGELFVVFCVPCKVFMMLTDCCVESTDGESQWSAFIVGGGGRETLVTGP